jgi:uncharacterized membrane protein YkvA (DUF1232 family)
MESLLLLHAPSLAPQCGFAPHARLCNLVSVIATSFWHHVLWWLVIGGAVIVLSWVVLVVLARRLPKGTLRDLAAFLPACVTMVRRLRRDPRVPRRAKLAIGFAGLWVISPIDLIPEFLPIIGPLDDIVVVAIALRYAARQVPPEVLFEAWPEDPALLARLIGKPRPEPQP